jgi:hypothetical protein
MISKPSITSKGGEKAHQSGKYKRFRPGNSMVSVPNVTNTHIQIMKGEMKVKNKKTIAKKLTAMLIIVSMLMVSFIPAASAATDPVKNAYLNGATVPANGTTTNPVIVDVGEQIKYQITANTSKETTTKNGHYDFLIMYNSSATMNQTINNTSAIHNASKLAQDLPNLIFAEYPDSRVALLGLSSGGADNNRYDANYLFPQGDTDFITKTQYAANPKLINDATLHTNSVINKPDNAAFLQAGVNKMRGLTIVNYWGAYQSKGMIPRKAVFGQNLAERTPVILFISDFIMTEASHSVYNNTKLVWGQNRPYWSDCMKNEADKFHQAFPAGILHTVRLEHRLSSNSSGINFTSSVYDNLMLNNVAIPDRGWGFTKIPLNTPYNTILANVKNDFFGKVSAPAAMGTIITDKVPEGLAVDVSSISHGGSYSPQTRTITWNLIGNEGAENVTVSFNTTVTEPSRFYNTANILSSNGTSFKTNTTYHRHEADITPAASVKNARVNDGDIDNGTVDNPVAVAMEDKITYAINAQNKKGPGAMTGKYDVLFVINWSKSNMGGVHDFTLNAGHYQAWLMEHMSDYILDEYPGSRVAMLGMGSNFYNNLYDPEQSYIIFQTDFLGKEQFPASFKSLNKDLHFGYSYAQTDNAIYLQAGTNKMKGLITAYGSPSSFVGPSKLIPRTAVPGQSLTERTPVIIMVSDYMMTEASHATSNNTHRTHKVTRPYWSDCMKTEADEFYRAFPDGILLNVRLEHKQNNLYFANFVTAAYDKLMLDNVANPERGWGFVKSHYNMPFDRLLEMVRDDFSGLVSKGAAQGAIITDVVPEGLEVDISSISHGGSYNSQSRTVTWDLTSYNVNETVTVSFDAIVQEPGTFANYADVKYFDGANDVTNTTYHRLALELEANVNVTHKDKDTGEVLDQVVDTVDPGPYGPYDPQIFPGYGLGVLAPDSDPASGTIDVGETKNVTYLYEKLPATATILVMHMDRSSNALLDFELRTVDAGSYAVTTKSFPGYDSGTLAPDSDPAIGTIAAGETKRVTYLYEKLPTTAPILVMHMDRQSGALLDFELKTVNAGSYTVDPKNCPGYGEGVLAPFSAPASGTIASGAMITVTWHYDKSVEIATITYLPGSRAHDGITGTGGTVDTVAIGSQYDRR